MMNRKIRTKLPMLIKTPDSKLHHLVRKRDRNVRMESKLYADKHRKARHREIKVGDHVLLQQKKTATNPPYNPDPLTEVKGTKVTAVRKTDAKMRSRNMAKFKLLKPRWERFQLRKWKTNQPEEEDSDDED